MDANPKHPNALAMTSAMAKQLQAEGVPQSVISRMITASNAERFDATRLMLLAPAKGNNAQQQTLDEVNTPKIQVFVKHSNWGYTDPSPKVVRRITLRDWDENEEWHHRQILTGIPFQVLSQDRHYKPAKKLASMTSITTTHENSSNLIASSIYNPDETKASLKMADQELVRCLNCILGC